MRNCFHEMAPVAPMLTIIGSAKQNASKVMYVCSGIMTCCPSGSQLLKDLWCEIRICLNLSRAPESAFTCILQPGSTAQCTSEWLVRVFNHRCPQEQCQYIGILVFERWDENFVGYEIITQLPRFSKKILTNEN